MPYADPLQMRFRLLSATNAEIGIVSTNSGTASLVCPEETVALPSLMTVWTEEPTFAVELERGAGCP